MKQRKQWVLWKLIKRGGKETKIPYQCNGNVAKSNDPNTWNTFDMAVNTYNEHQGYVGIGYVFSSEDPYVFIDFDHCIADGGAIDPEITSWLKKLNSYSEKSVSGKGIHVIIKGEIPTWSGNRKNNVEIYSHDRFAVMTGDVIEPYTSIEHRQDVLEELCENLFGNSFPKQIKPSTNSFLTTKEIIEKASKATNGAKFLKLFNGDITGYPSQSEADLAFVSMIAFWTQDKGQIMDIVRQSKLYDAKWERKDYQKRTIDKALSELTETYKSKTQESTYRLLNDFHLTDVGNGKRLAFYYGDIIRYCDGWYIWNGTFWEQNDRKVEEIAKQTVQKIYSEASACNDENRRKQIAEHAIRSESAFRIKAMLEMAKSEPKISVSRDIFDTDPDLINTLNGVVDLRTGELLNHKPDYYMTKMVNAEYDPEAKSDLWEKFLNTVTNENLELKDFLQRAVGYSLTGRTDEEKLFFVHGQTATGKSSFIEAIKTMMGQYAKTADFESFIKHKDMFRTVRNDIAILAGARFVVSIEVDRGKRMAEGLIKMLTGGDTIRARLLYRESFEFVPQMKLWLVANHKPKVDADDDAMWRRILVIPFCHFIPEEERDPQIKVMLKTDPNVQKAIFAWAVKGAIAWYEKGLGIPEMVRQATKVYQEEMDIISAFFNECTEREIGAYTPKAELYQAYVNFCKENGETPQGKISFNRLVIDLGYKEDRITDGIRVFRGLKLK